MFVDGLASVDARAVGRIKNSMNVLGLAGLAERLDKLVAADDARTRFKIATRLVLALDQLSISLVEPPKRMSGRARPLQGCPMVDLHPGSLPCNDEEVKRMARSGRGLIELIEYVRSSLDPLAVDPETLHTVLSHSHLHKEVLGRISVLPAAERLRLGGILVGKRNRLLRTAGAAILLNIDDDGARLLLLKHLGRPDVCRMTGPRIRKEPSLFRDQLFTAFDEAADPATRTELARHFRLVKPAKEHAALLKDLAGDEDPDVAAYASMALYTAGVLDGRSIRNNMVDLENHVLRIYSKIELLKSGDIDPKYILSEFNSDSPRVHRITIEALEDLGRYEAANVLEPLMNEALYAKNRAARKDNVAKLIHLHGEPFEEFFMQVAFDPDEEVARAARNRLIELWGFQGLELFTDPWKAILGEPDRLGMDEVHEINYFVLPYMAVTGDCRFAAYLGQQFLDYCSSGRQYDYEHELKPLLLDYGEPLIEILGEYLFLPDQNISLAAEDLLINIGGPEAGKTLSNFHSGSPPIEIALRQLGNPATAEHAKKVIIEEGPGTIPTLLDMLHDPKCRKHVVDILVHFAEPSTFPALLRLLGNPAQDLSVSGDISMLLRDTGFAEREITGQITRLGEAIVDSLVERLDDENWTVRYHAALILGKIGSPRSVPALVRLLQREQDSLEVIRGVITALGEIRTGEALPVILGYLDDMSRELRFDCYRALAMIGNPDALPALEKALGNCSNLAEKRVIKRTMDELRRAAV